MSGCCYVTSQTYWYQKLSHICGALLQMIHINKVPIMTFCRYTKYDIIGVLRSSRTTFSGYQHD